MGRGTWQIAQGSDLASQLPRSQSNPAFTVEPAPCSHPSRLRGSPVNVLLTGSTGHSERSMSAFCWVRICLDRKVGGGGARQEVWTWRLELRHSCWQRSIINRVAGHADHINVRESDRPERSLRAFRHQGLELTAEFAFVIAARGRHTVESEWLTHTIIATGEFLHNIVAATMAAHLQGDLGALIAWVSVTHQNSFQSLSVWHR